MFTLIGISETGSEGNPMDKVEKRKENHAQEDAVGSGFPLLGGIPILIVTRHGRKKGEVDSKKPEKRVAGVLRVFGRAVLARYRPSKRASQTISSHKASQKRKAPPNGSLGKG